MIKVNYTQSIEGYDVYTTIFSFLLGILTIKIFAEPRIVENGVVQEYKFFVYVKLFGFTVLYWTYRDKYIRDFYTNVKDPDDETKV